MNCNREYFPESEIDGGDLLAHLDDESVAFFGISASGERRYRRKHMPPIFGTPVPVTLHGPLRDEGVIEAEDDDLEDVRAAGRARLLAAFNETGEIEQAIADSDPDLEAELQELRAAAIDRLNEQIEQIRIDSWSRDWSPDAEGGLDVD